MIKKNNDFNLCFYTKKEFLKKLSYLDILEYKQLEIDLHYFSYDYIKSVTEPLLFTIEIDEKIISILQVNILDNQEHINNILNDFSKKTIQIAYISTNILFRGQGYAKYLLDSFFYKYSQDYFLESSFLSEDGKLYILPIYKSLINKYKCPLYISSFTSHSEMSINNVLIPD